MSRKKKKRKTSSGKRRSAGKSFRSDKYKLDVGAELDKAAHYHGSGQLRKAEKIYNKILKTNPTHSDCLNLLGLIAHQTGNTDRAAYLINKAILNDPDNPVYLNDLGNVLKDQGKFDEAIACYQRVIDLEPELQDLVGAHYNMGNAFRDQGKLSEAMSCYKEALRLKPDLAGVHYTIGLLLNEIGQYEEAISCYKQALELNPDFPEPHNALGIALNEIGQYEEAISCYKQALALKPDFVPALSNLAYVFEQTNRIIDAREAASKALRYDSSDPMGNLVVAKSQRREGNYETALSKLEKSNVKLASSFIRAAILNEKGNIYDRLEEYDKAFECFSQANSVASQTWVAREFNRNSFIRKISLLKSYFSDRGTSSWDVSMKTSNGPDPIFLVGFPRSGTTLLTEILNAQANIETLDERPVVTTMIHHLDKYGLKYPDDLVRIDFDLIDDLKKAYFQKKSEFLPDRRDTMFVDKLPLNIVHIGLIHTVFPTSKIVFALRHPCDACLSCFMQNFALNEGMIHFLNLESTAKLYDLVMALFDTYTNRLPLNLHVIKYEDLVSSFDEETRKLFDFLEIPAGQPIGDHTLRARSGEKIATPSYHQVSEPIYTRSMYRWKHYVKHLVPILDILKPHVIRFGYDLPTENTS
jgi:tetratricopeptide (TPR) repeat protein